MFLSQTIIKTVKNGSYTLFPLELINRIDYDE